MYEWCDFRDSSVVFEISRDEHFIEKNAYSFRSQAIFGPKGFALKIARVLEYPERQQLYIELKERLRKKSNYTLNLRWYARLETEPEGFYVDQYDGNNGLKRCVPTHIHMHIMITISTMLSYILHRYLAATVFRPGFARRAFPCFDEPHMRAPFRISVFRDRFHIGLSNSIVHATDDVGFYMGTGLVSEHSN